MFKNPLIFISLVLIGFSIDLGTDPKGEDLVISFVVNTVTADNNGGQGVVIDDVGFHWACKLL